MFYGALNKSDYDYVFIGDIYLRPHRYLTFI